MMLSFLPNPSCFNLPNHDHSHHISSAIQSAASSDDISLVTSDGSVISTSKILLCLSSAFLTKLLSITPTPPCMPSSIILPDCSTTSLCNLISLLTNGRGVSRHVGSDYRPASDVIDTGILLGVRFGSLDYEVARDSRRETVPRLRGKCQRSNKQTNSQNIESNKEPFVHVDQSIESSNVEDKDVSKPPQRSKINKSQTYERSNGENKNVIDQQNVHNKIDHSSSVITEAQDKTRNKNSPVEDQKDTKKPKKRLSEVSKYPLREASCEDIQNRMESDWSESSIRQLPSIKSGATQENKTTLMERELIRSSKMSLSDTTENISNILCQCDTCGKLCRSKRGLQLHMQCHSGIIFTCSTCGKLFKSRKGWQAHENAHSAQNWNNFVRQESPAQHETEGSKESSSILTLEKNKISKTKKRKNTALEKKSSNSTLQKRKNESKEDSFVPSGNKKDGTGKSKVCVEDGDIGNKNYDVNKVSTKIVSNDIANNNIIKTKIQKETASSTMENKNVIESCSTKNKTSRSTSKHSRSSFGCSDNYEVPKAKKRERTASGNCLKKQSNLSTVDSAESAEGIFKNVEDEAESIFKNLEDEKFRRNLITKISQSTDINSFERNDSSDKNTPKTFQDSKRYKKKAIGKEKSAKPNRLPLSSPRKCEEENELLMPSPVRGRSRKCRQKSLKTDYDHLDFEWEDDFKLSSDDEDSSPSRWPNESTKTSNKPRTASQVDSETTDNGSVPCLLANSQSTSNSEQGNFFPSSHEFSDTDTH